MLISAKLAFELSAVICSSGFIASAINDYANRDELEIRDIEDIPEINTYDELVSVTEEELIDSGLVD